MQICCFAFYTLDLLDFKTLDYTVLSMSNIHVYSLMVKYHSLESIGVRNLKGPHVWIYSVSQENGTLDSL